MSDAFSQDHPSQTGADARATSQAEATTVAAHVTDATAAHAATAIAVTPAGALAATNVQTALAELDSEKAAAAHEHADPVVDSITDTGGTGPSLEFSASEVVATGKGTLQ